jgi:hypothetical protein
MLKRLVAIIFVFVVAGQVSAGVCGCVGGGNKSIHSCCKRDKIAGDSIRNKGCCDAECMVRQSDRPVQDRRAPQAELQFQTADEPLDVLKFTFERVAVRRAVSSNHFTNHRLKYARPPELYLRHHAFLI